MENRGHRSSLPGAHAVDVAAATRLRGAPLLSAPTPSSAALLRLPDAVTARSTSSDRLLSARSLVCSPVGAVQDRQSTWRGDFGNGSRTSWRRLIPSSLKIFQWKQRSAARSQQLSVPLPAMQRGSALQRTLASTPSTPVSDQRSGPKPYYQRVYACSFSARPAAHSSACAALVVC